MMLCTDKSRYNFWYLWLQKELKEDPMLVSFRKEYFTQVQPKVNNLIDQYIQTNPDDLEIYVDITNTKCDVKRERLGRTSKLTNDFIKTIANQTRILSQLSLNGTAIEDTDNEDEETFSTLNDSQFEVVSEE